MADSLMHLTITGNVGKAPEMKNIGGQELHSFSVAVNKSRKLPNSEEWVKRTYWYLVDCWSTLPAGVEKGAQVTIMGEFELGFDKATDKPYINNEGMPMLKLRTSRQGIVVHRQRQEGAAGNGFAAQGSTGQAPASAAPVNTPGGNPLDDELPF